MSSSRDRQILNSIINPLLPIGEAVYDEEAENTDNTTGFGVSETTEVRISKEYENEGVKAAEKGDFAEAIAKFGRGLYPSIHLVSNNCFCNVCYFF